MIQPTTILSAALLGAVLGQPVQAQGDMVARKEAKLAEAWLKNADWVLDYTDAKAQAKQTGKPIFAYFTRSYAP